MTDQQIDLDTTIATTCGICHTSIVLVEEAHVSFWSDDDGDQLAYSPTLHDHEPIDDQADGPAWTYVVDAEDEDAYLAWCASQILDDGLLLPMSVDRLAPSNACDECGEAPTTSNPVTVFAGMEADTENGPSAADLPVALCDRCEHEV